MITARSETLRTEKRTQPMARSGASPAVASAKIVLRRDRHRHAIAPELRLALSAPHSETWGVSSDPPRNNNEAPPARRPAEPPPLALAVLLRGMVEVGRT